MRRSSSSGFSLIELIVVIGLFGLIIGLSLPSLRNFNKGQKLKGASEGIANQLRMSREIAIGTGKTQTMHFVYQWLYNGKYNDYHIHNGAVVGAVWSLPRGITFNWAAGTQSSYTFATDGRSNVSGMVIVQDDRPVPDRDTISVQTSGLILTR